ncbi:hypothetical protein ACFX2I_039894 [Malus domestica]
MQLTRTNVPLAAIWLSAAHMHLHLLLFVLVPRSIPLYMPTTTAILMVPISPCQCQMKSLVGCMWMVKGRNAGRLLFMNYICGIDMDIFRIR